MSDDLEEENEPQDNPNIKRLRERAKQAEEAERRAEAAEQKLLFAEAGLDLSDPRLKYFQAGYDGEKTVDAIRAAAEKDGFLKTAEQTPAVPTEEQQALERMSQATEGASTPAPPDEDQDLRDLARDHHGSLGEFTMEMGRLLHSKGRPVTLEGEPFPG